MKTVIKRKTAAILAILLLLFPALLFSQQVIKFKNGNVYEVKIISKNSDSVKYEMSNAPGMVFSAGMNQIESIWVQSKIIQGKPSMPDSEYYAEKISGARTKVAVGSVLIGVGVLAAGGGLLIKVERDEYDHPNSAKDVRNQALKTVLIVLGSAVTVTGITLAAVGGSSEKKYRDKMNKLSLDFKCSPSMTGLAIRYHF